MSFEEEKKCPLCAEEMDWTDQQLNPCKCGYEVCVWCWHHIMDMAEKDATEGRCPACRTPYDKDRIVGLETNFQRVVGNGSSRKQKVTKAKAKPNEGRKDLSNVRVMQRKMAYIIGLPIDLADEDLLQRKEYFGQYGKVTKISLSRTAGGALQQFINDSCSVYITYSKEEEAMRCIQSVHGYVWDGRLLRASFGTAKYCHAWLRNTPCNNPSCLYLHTLGAEEDSFGRDEVAAVHTRNRVQEIVGSTHYPHKRSGSMLPPPIVDQLNKHIARAQDPVCNNGSPDVAHATEATSEHLPVRSSKQTTTFVDIVGRPSNSTVKDVNLIEEEQISNLETKSSDSLLLKSSTPDQLVTSPTSDDQNLKVFVGSSHSGSSIPSPAADTAKSSIDHSWWHTENNNQVSNYVEEDTIPAPCMNSLSNEAYNEKKFQSSAKSDRIYRGANSFSNEEIVEHLRRLDDDTPVDNDENFAAVESSIISNILSMDLDDDNSDYTQTVSGLFETRDRRHGSSWNFQNNDQSRFSFGKELGFSNQQNDLPGSIGQGLNLSLQDSCENKDDFFKSQQQASRGSNVGPPGFSMPCKPPPGFSTSMRTEQAIPASSGNYVRVAPNNHYRSPSLGNLSNGSDDLIDPVVGGKSSTNGLHTNSWTSSFSSRCSSSFEDLKHSLFMQQQPVPAAPIPHPQDPQIFQATMQQQQTPQFLSSQDQLYGGLTSGLMDLQQSYNPSLFTQQPMYANGYQQPNPLQESQHRNNRSAVERFGFESFLPGYGDYMFQMPTSGDVYTRVFGM
uniref:uncharacterized protein LOC122585034 isoform X2 n=1 Tax=Erigeron canadensis TaxID=72917 RepID=UPI001CB9BEAD|nr:uncharacterized protein LOC122585034 isoform X2 [Erigeron canadensis]